MGLPLCNAGWLKVVEDFFVICQGRCRQFTWSIRPWSVRLGFFFKELVDDSLHQQFVTVTVKCVRLGVIGEIRVADMSWVLPSVLGLLTDYGQVSRCYC